MNILAELRSRFAAALEGWVDDPAPLVDLVRPSQDPRFGDYQANCAMPLAKQLGKSSKEAREVAGLLAGRLQVSDLCEPPEVAGPGFINLKLRDDWLAARTAAALQSERLAVPKVEQPRTYVIDFSAPNVAKPMHVGHIRSTVIGAALVRVLRFLGHRVIGDNHIGDWGTQFGMILYGHRHFLDEQAYQQHPVAELSRLYRLVRQLIDYHDACRNLPKTEEQIQQREQQIEQLKPAAQAKDKEGKAAAKQLKRLQAGLGELRDQAKSLASKIAAVDNTEQLAKLAEEHRNVNQDVLAETAALHAGDERRLTLWREFMPVCLEDINRIYDRLGVTFDETLGESFYHDQLAAVVEDLKTAGTARESEGAICVFLPGSDVPMIVQKRDGAFLYATTDLATIRYRMERWQPDAVLYVVDHRQSLHFEQLFEVARLWGYEGVEFAHVGFGTVMGDDNKPFQTRSGDTVGLEGLLDEAVERALAVVVENDRSREDAPARSPEEQQEIAEVVGIGAIKYADLSQNRTSDYTFSYDKMLAMQGYTATYLQYAHARVRSIFAKGDVDAASLQTSPEQILITTTEERALVMNLLRFSEALEMSVADYRPNQLTAYLYDIAMQFSKFFVHCPVLKAESAELRHSRLLFCDLTARTLKQGLELLGIEVRDRM